jgi:hypothetical protein
MHVYLLFRLKSGDLIEDDELIEDEETELLRLMEPPRGGHVLPRNPFIEYESVEARGEELNGEEEESAARASSALSIDRIADVLPLDNDSGMEFAKGRYPAPTKIRSGLFPVPT